jgi:tyrosyl-tRNA synthetase
MTTLVHGEDAVAKVEKAAEALFGKAELYELDEQTLASALSETEVAEVAADATILDLLVGAGLEKTKGAARRTVSEGGAYVNNVRISEIDWTPDAGNLLHGSWLVLRKGKKRFAGARVQH